MELEVAAQPPARFHLEPPKLPVADDDVIPDARKTSREALDILPLDQEIDVREHPLPRIVVEIDQVGAPLQEDERHAFVDEMPSDRPELGQRLEVVQGGLAVRPGQGLRPYGRQRFEPARRAPETVEVPPALVPLQRGIERIRGPIVRGRLQPQEGGDRIAQEPGGEDRASGRNRHLSRRLRRRARSTA